MNTKTEFINLSASARLIYQLGEQLISDELVALMELIKNAYDSDSTEVKVYVDTNIETDYGLGRITIEDNGNGMVPSIIKDGFLRLSTNFKKENRLSPHFKRRVLGEKGLGRLSFQRLGRYIKVSSCPRIDRIGKLIKKSDREYISNYNEFDIELDWDLLSKDMDLDLVKAKVECSSVKKPKYGTRIEIYGIRNQNFWYLKKKDETRLKNEIFGMINPFVKDKKSKFQIYLTINGKLFTNVNIDEDVINKISDINVKFSFEDWIFKVNIEKKYRYVKGEIQDIIDEMKKHEFQLENEKEFKDYFVQYTLDFNNMDSINIKYPYLKDLRFDVIDGEKAYPGDFNGAIYAAEFSREKQSELMELIQTKEFTEDIKTYNALKSVWDAANGVYIFRNDFRILPYGKKDWIGFTKKSQTYKNNIYKEHTVAGYINIDGETSENLIEQTNRQGIVEDEYGSNFLRIFDQVLLELIIREDVKFRDGFDIDKSNLDNSYIETKNKILSFKKVIIEEDRKDKLFDQVQDTIKKVSKQNNYSSEDELRNILSRYFENQNDINKILKTSDDTIKLMLNAIIDSLHKGNEVYSFINTLKKKIYELKSIDEKIKQRNEQERYIKDKEMQELYDLLPMVGQGIIVESLTHELNRIDENIKTYALKTKDALTKKEIYNIEDLINCQQLIIDETAYLRAQLNHLEPTYRKNNKTFDQINVRDFIVETYKNKGPMSKKAIEKGIAVKVTGNSFMIEVNRGYLITVFDNLFLNSLYWINENVNRKYIQFEISNDGKVIIWDSGPGIHEEIESELFQPFKSMKREGRGLGLFIAKELLNSMNAEITLLEERRNNRLYKFQIKFNNILEE